MYRLPPASPATPLGAARLALVARPPSPPKLYVPFPATVVMMPEATTSRMRWLFVSAMYRLPAASTATPVGPARLAFVAGPPSPPKPEVPVPATVVMKPDAATLRIRWTAAVYRLPEVHT